MCIRDRFHCGDVAIFRIFKMAVAAILDFWNREIILVVVVQSVETHQHAKFRQNRSIGCEDIKIFQFFKMAAVRHFGFVWGIFGPPTVIICGSLYHSAKFGYDRAVIFIIWTLQYFARFAENAYHAPKIGVFGQFDPLNGLRYQQKPKKARPCVSPRHLSH